MHQRLAAALAHIDMLTRATVSSWQELACLTESTGDVDALTAARGRHAGARTIAESLDAALLVFSHAGGSAMSVTNPLPRFLRDLLAMRNHPMAAVERFAGEQARLELDANPWR